MKKKFLAISLISALILSCSVFLIGLMPEKAMAEGDTPAADPTVNFEVVGASIRKIAPMGLRFEVKINADAANAATELGMYLCPTELLTDGKFDDVQLKNNVMDEADTHASDDKYIRKVSIGSDQLTADPENSDKKLLRLSLVNLVPSSLDKQFSAMAYIKIGENEKTSETIERSVAYVARRTLADPDSGLSESGDDRRFVNAIVENSNDFYITTSGVSVDTTVKREDKFTHKITLGEGGTKDIELSLDKTFEKDVICGIKLFAKANAANITINGKDVDTNDFTEITLDDIQVADNKALLHIAGGTKDDPLWIDDIRAEGMKSLGTDGIRLSATGGAEGVSTLTRHTDTNTVEYNAGGWQRDHVGFTPGKTIGSDEYLVIKFRYYSDMEEEGTYYFTPDTYSNEGLWIQGLGGENTHEKDYFSTFDENYLDYTLYMHGDGDTSYEGTKVTVPYGSLHGTKGVTTMPGTWYYAVAPVAGNYQKISSCNSYLHIEIADIYGVKGDIKEKLFVPQNYPKSICVPFGICLTKDETRALSTFNIPANSMNITERELIYTAPENNGVVTIENGVITAVGVGTCKITVALTDGSISKEAVVNVDDGTNLSLARLYAIGNGTMTDTDEGYKSYDSNGKCWKESMIGIQNVPSDKYIVLKFRYIAQTDANDFYMYYGDSQDKSEYEPAKGRQTFDYAFIFNAETNVDMTNYDTNGTPWDFPKTMAECNWYYWVSPNKGAYKGFTSDKPLKCIISNIYAYTAEERQEILKNADSNSSGVVELGLNCLSVVGSGPYGTFSDTDEGYKYYDSKGNRCATSEIGITDAPSDKYIVFKFQYIEVEANTDFYAYKGGDQPWSEYRTGAESDRYDFAFLFEYDEETNTYKDMTSYTNDVPKGAPQKLTSGNWYYWVSANKGTYEGYTSDQILKCNVSNVYAYTAAARLATFGIAVKE